MIINFLNWGGVRSRNWGKLKAEQLDKSDANIILYLNTQKLLIDVIKSRNVKAKIWVVSDIVNQLFDEATQYNKMLNLISCWIQNGVKFEYFRYPRATDIINKSLNEKFLCDNEIIPADYRKNFEKYKERILKVIGYNDSEENIDKYLINIITPIINKGQTIELQDMHSRYINIVDGKRVVTNQKDMYENTVYIVGPSWVFGKYEKDDDTIASCIQRMLNESSMQYKVVNCGIPGMHWQKMINNMLNICPYKGDVIILVDLDNNLENFLEEHNAHINRKQNFIQRPHLHGEIFADRDHLNAKGVSLLAEAIFRKTFVEVNIQKKISMVEVPENQDNLLYQLNYLDESEWKFQNELESYINKLPENRKNVNGAIVMNCNPFTRGHRYLIESAAKQVDTLYVFVVEEDKSFFPFKERLMLVRNGVKDLSNVIVLASGKFMISSLTFPEYFVKEDNRDVVIDTSKDLRLFWEKIAPKLEITKRFAGAEPNDNVTAQYNRDMQKYLPGHGIDFIEIPRIEKDGLPISASLVRKYLKEKQWEKISGLVPESTYEYLRQNYS